MLSHFSLFSLQSVIQQLRHLSDWTHTLSTCTNKNIMNLIALRESVTWGCILELREDLLLIFPSHVKSCRTHSSTQCSICLTARISLWDVYFNYSCLQRDELPETMKLTIVFEELLLRTYFILSAKSTYFQIYLISMCCSSSLYCLY